MLARREARLAALLLGIVATLALHFAARSEGFTRDEGYYFDAAEYHAAFYENVVTSLAHGSLAGFSRAAVDKYFSYNHEHPPLMKTLYGLSWRLLHRCDCNHQGGRHPLPYPRRHPTLSLLSEADAMRLPAHLFGGLMVALVFLFGARAFSPRAGLVAAVLSLAAPRLFFHAELSCFDAPMATTWLLTVYCYYRSLDDDRYALATGVAFGLSLATKHNGFFLPFVLGGHYLWTSRHRLLALRLPHVPRAFWLMATVGPLVYLALWPWLWFDTVARLREYFAFHLHHVYYNFEYLGTNYNKPPFPRAVAFVMTLLTAPVTTLALALCGTGALAARAAMARFGSLLRLVPLRGERGAAEGPVRAGPPPPPVRLWRAATVGLVERPPAGRGASSLADGDPIEQTAIDPDTGGPRSIGLLVFLNALFPPAIIAVTGAPIFGATKHWLPAIPFLALLAGVGLDAIVLALRDLYALAAPRARALSAVAVLFAVAPAIAETARSHPYGLSHYNLLAGGPAGGADLGMNRQFWGYSTRSVLDWLNRHSPKNGAVYWHDANQPMLNMDVREGLLRPDLWNTGLEEPGVKASTTAMVIHEKHFDKYEYWIWDFYGTTRPSFVLADEGVPLVTVYQRPTAGSR